jgi:hypothetical protein
MRKQDPVDTPEDDEPLVDTTAALPLRSKRTERRQKKRYLKAAVTKPSATFTDLPPELFLQILGHALPSDIFILSRASRGLRNLIYSSRSLIADSIISHRYSVLSQCFPRPVLLSNVDQDVHAALLDPERQEKFLQIKKKPYQHIKPRDPNITCTCLTCVLAWNNLCVLVDFAYWQSNLEQGEPIPMIPRGKYPQWNQSLIEKNAQVVEKALHDKLWYARILEAHLKSTVSSIRRHSKNAGNKRRRFRMTQEDTAKEDDTFLQRSGPPTIDFPFHRDNYYMLEAYLPNRGWNSEAGEWRYMPKTQHDTDIGFVKAWAKRRQNDSNKLQAATDAELK